MSSLHRRFGLPADLTPSVCHSVLLSVCYHYWYSVRAVLCGWSYTICLPLCVSQCMLSLLVFCESCVVRLILHHLSATLCFSVYAITIGILWELCCAADLTPSVCHSVFLSVCYHYWYSVRAVLWPTGIPCVDETAREVADRLGLSYRTVLQHKDGEERLINSHDVSCVWLLMLEVLLCNILF